MGSSTLFCEFLPLPADRSHRHLSYMLESHLFKPEKTYFNALANSVQCVEYLQSRGLDFSALRQVPMWDARRGYPVTQTVTIV